jgi:hypothetical protein
MVANCEAFLRGRYAERLMERAERVPPWAWLNLVAHGTCDDLASAREPRRLVGSTILYTHWVAARSYVIGEVFTALDSERGPLPRLQARVLRPLESELAADGLSVRFPRDLVGRVLQALEADEREHGGHPQR